MTYSDKAFAIVKRSINSAVFIDEKAWEFYSSEPQDPTIIEHQLSTDLYESFKSEGVSLAVHKFKESDLSNESIKRYLLKDRDLVLLDWELEDGGGIQYSLELLSDIIQYPHINFCCIYTSTANFDDIAHHINSYFSGFSQDNFGEIVTAYSFLDTNSIELIFSAINSNDEAQIDEVFALLGIDSVNFPIDLSESENNPTFILSAIYYAFNKYVKSEKQEIAVTSINTASGCIIINNTFILILNKDVENDTKPSQLIRRISDELIKPENKNSFLQLLGLEMQTIFGENESFINENLLQSSTEAFFTHRNFLKARDGDDIPFNSLIKKIMIEHAGLRLRTAKLSLLETAFLDQKGKEHHTDPSNEEIASMNTFYNSVNVGSLNNIDFPKVNFGDIFYDETNKDYYLCITALCDCLRPKKIKQNYYFVKGKEINIQIANSLGDAAFISYIPNNKAISWINIESTKSKKCNNTELSEEQVRINNLEAENKVLQQFKYKPVYIQPHTFNIKNPRIEEDSILISRIIPDNVDKEKRDIEQSRIKYITSLRPNYTQRIANHAFTHPVRVGVDFISKQ